MSETSFTDRDGDVFTAEAWTDPVDGAELMELSVQATDGDNLNMQFYKADAAKIIHLIAEAAAVKPTWDDVNAQLNSLLRPADSDESTEDMGQ